MQNFKIKRFIPKIKITATQKTRKLEKCTKRKTKLYKKLGRKLGNN